MRKLYRILPDETIVMYSQRKENGTMIVHFERPVDDGFDSARCELPGLQWLCRKGYVGTEIQAFETMLCREGQVLLTLGQALGGTKSQEAREAAKTKK